MKFKTGDTVIVSKNFMDMRYDGDPGVCPEMYIYAGQRLTIEATWKEEVERTVPFDVDDKVWYRVNENEWTWDERWFEPYEYIDETIYEIKDDVMTVFEGD